MGVVTTQGTGSGTGFNLVLAEGGTLNVTDEPAGIGSGSVTNVTGTAPIVITGLSHVTPNVTITPATDVAAGSLSAADKTKLDGIAPGAAVSTVTASNGIASSGGDTPNLTWAGLGDIGATGLVDTISGPSPILITPAALEWTQGTLAPTITQAQQANASPPQTMTIAPQAPGAGATNATNGTPAGLTVSLAAPVNSGLTPYFRIAQTGGPTLSFGALPNLSTLNDAGFWGVSPGTESLTNYGWLYSVIGGGFNFLAPTAGTVSSFNFGYLAASTVGMFLGTVSPASGSGINLTGLHTQFGGGAAVAKLENATAEPTSNASTLFWSFTNGALKWRSANGWTGNLAALGAGALNSQKPNVDTFSAVVRTVSSATPTAFPAYTTAADTIGWINVRLKSKCQTAASGNVVGDGAFAEYRLGYRNIAGTVTLSTAGITLLGAVQTTSASLTSVLTAAAATNTVVFSVTNVATNTVDSLIDCTIDVC